MKKLLIWSAIVLLAVAILPAWLITFCLLVGCLIFALWAWARVVTSSVAKKFPADAMFLSNKNQFKQEIVGESFHKKDLREIAEGHDNKARITEQAYLLLEDDNPHDSHAVAVYIQGYKVGHLSRQKARAFREEYSHIGGAFRCQVLLFGADDPVKNIGVWLDI